MTITIPFWIIPVASFICGAVGAITFDLLNKKLKWKPSEEQIDRLFSIVAALRKDYCEDMADFLASLYKQLKAL